MNVIRMPLASVIGVVLGWLVFSRGFFRVREAIAHSAKYRFQYHFAEPCKTATQRAVVHGNTPQRFTFVRPPLLIGVLAGAHVIAPEAVPKEALQQMPEQVGARRDLLAVRIEVRAQSVNVTPIY